MYQLCKIILPRTIQFEINQNHKKKSSRLSKKNISQKFCVFVAKIDFKAYVTVKYRLQKTAQTTKKTGKISLEQQIGEMVTSYVIAFTILLLL